MGKKNEGMNNITFNMKTMEEAQNLGNKIADTSNNSFNNTQGRFTTTGTESGGGTKRTIEDGSPQTESIGNKKKKKKKNRKQHKTHQEKLTCHTKQHSINSHHNHSATWGTHPTW